MLLLRLDLSEWAALFNVIVATLSEPRVAAIADLADVDPILVPQPAVLHIVTSQEIDFLPPIAGATGPRGPHLQADPALSLADPAVP